MLWPVESCMRHMAKSLQGLAWQFCGIEKDLHCSHQAHHIPYKDHAELAKLQLSLSAGVADVCIHSILACSTDYAHSNYTSYGICSDECSLR